MPKKNLILAGVIIIVLILIGIGFSYGYWLVEKKPAQIQLLGLETSAVIQAQHALASGEVIEIANRTLTLRANGDTLTIPIAEEVRVTVLILEERAEAGVEQKEIEFKTLKIGDQVNVLIELKPDGVFEGVDITVLPE